MTDQTQHRIVNIDDLDLNEFGNGDKFEAKLGRIGPVIGLSKLGAMLTCVEPGKRAFPYHNHHSNEEAFFVLAGTGEYRLGNARHPIKAGDFLAAPSGGPETAHQIINTGSETLKYIALSTKQDPEVVEYPDSGKFGALSALGSSEWPPKQGIRYIGRMDSGTDYFDGE